MVLLIISFGVALLAPKVAVGTRQMRERDFVLAVHGLLQRARVRAMTSGRPVVAVLERERRVITVGGSRELSIPSMVDLYGEGLIEEPQGYTMWFYPDGTTSAKGLEIVFERARKVFMEFSPLTGAISWYEVSS